MPRGTRPTGPNLSATGSWECRALLAQVWWNLQGTVVSCAEVHGTNKWQVRSEKGDGARPAAAVLVAALAGCHGGAGRSAAAAHRFAAHAAAAAAPAHRSTCRQAGTTLV